MRTRHDHVYGRRTLSLYSDRLTLPHSVAIRKLEAWIVRTRPSAISRKIGPPIGAGDIDRIEKMAAEYGRTLTDHVHEVLKNL